MSLPFRVIEPPANADDLARLAATFGTLPPSYLAFLGSANGAEWGMHDEGGDCLVIWSAHELPDMNEAYEVQQWLPEVLVFGSDGGGHAIAFDRSSASNPESWPIVRIPFGALAREEFVLLAPGFREWQTQEFRIRPSPNERSAS